MTFKKIMKGQPGIAVIVTIAGSLLGACVSYGHRPVPPESFRAPATVLAAQDAPAQLGRALFFDTRLSGANDLSCAACHQPGRGFEDGRAIAIGTRGRIGKRSTPTLIGIGAARRLMWDGRVRSLEAQALMPIANPEEMNQNLDALVAELAADPATRAAFAAAFPHQPRISIKTIAAALAAYERSIRPEVSRFDRFVSGDTAALTTPERRGFALFAGKAGCAQCHSGPLLTDGRLHDVGLAAGSTRTRFKTPTLRHIAVRAPYMHDGSLATLDAVVAHYAEHRSRRTGVPAPVPLDTSERADLVAFLHSLGPADR
jgi:cytochrome c peroxidase